MQMRKEYLIYRHHFSQLTTVFWYSSSLFISFWLYFFLLLVDSTCPSDRVAGRRFTFSTRVRPLRWNRQFHSFCSHRFANGNPFFRYILSTNLYFNSLASSSLFSFTFFLLFPFSRSKASLPVVCGLVSEYWLLLPLTHIYTLKGRTLLPVSGLCIFFLSFAYNP